MKYHFAQFNVARLKFPLEHPAVADFRNAIDPIHALADKAPGFVWRYAAEGQNDALTVRPLGEDGIINFTVWESREAMAAFVYKNEHAAALRRRKEWFHAAQEHNVVMWWVPQGHVPTLDEALKRLEFLRRHGPTPLAFTYKEHFAPEATESFTPAASLDRHG